MRLLLDSCIWGPTAERLRAAGHDVVWAGDWPSDPADVEILRRAFDEARILVTIDKDFGELAVLHGAAHHGILRVVNFSASRQAEVCLEAIERHGDELNAGGLVTAEPGRFRIRPR